MTRMNKNIVFTEVCDQLNLEGFNGIAGFTTNVPRHLGSRGDLETVR